MKRRVFLMVPCLAAVARGQAGDQTVVPKGPLVEGKAASKVRLLIYEDLQCPDCAAFRVMMDEKLLPRYASQAAFEHRDFPLKKHAWARQAAIAARHFQGVRPELAVQFRRETMGRLKEIPADGFSAWVAQFAQKNALDATQAQAALSDPALAALVEEDYQEGIARGVARTPTVLVNGEPFIETFTFDQIAKAIEAQLDASGKP
jgi:protein-disulfide isomerase